MTYPHRQRLLVLLREARGRYATDRDDWTLDPYSRKQAGHYADCLSREIQIVENWADRDAADLVRSKQL